MRRITFLLLVLLAAMLAAPSLHAQKQRKKPPKQEHVQTPETAVDKEAANRQRIESEYETRLESHRNNQDKATRKRMKQTYKRAKDYGNGKKIPFYKRWFGRY
jgi:Ni/Co efflux regulator RcnB